LGQWQGGGSISETGRTDCWQTGGKQAKKAQNMKRSVEGGIPKGIAKGENRPITRTKPSLLSGQLHGKERVLLGKHWLLVKDLCFSGKRDASASGKTRIKKTTGGKAGRGGAKNGPGVKKSQTRPTWSFAHAPRSTELGETGE